jgi:hypothetical protein
MFFVMTVRRMFKFSTNFFITGQNKTKSKCRVLAKKKSDETGTMLEHSPSESLRHLGHEIMMVSSFKFTLFPKKNLYM